MHLILASASKGREYLLKQLKIPFEIVHTNLDEEKIVGKSPAETVQLRAKQKCESVVERITNQELLSKKLPTTNYQPPTILILTADTEVILNNQLIGKPKNFDDAVRMLKMLSGKTHEVVTAVYILSLSPKSPKLPKSPKKLIYSGNDRSRVTFRRLTDEDIRIYLSLTEYNKYTGSYALIASPQNFITKIEGSISNVIGLPMEKIIPIFSELGLLKT